MPKVLTVWDEIITDIEVWLAVPHDGFDTMQDAIDCELAESGADREVGFDLEAEQEKRYHAFLATVNN